MKIVGLELVVVGAPWRELTFVELSTDEGSTGVAEARMVNKTETLLACLRELGERYVIGRDPFDVEALVDCIERLEYGRPGEVAETALAMFEIACFDLMGKSLGVPVYQLLGGRVRDRIPAYANGWYQGAARAGRGCRPGPCGHRARLPSAQDRPLWYCSQPTVRGGAEAFDRHSRRGPRGGGAGRGHHGGNAWPVQPF